MIQVSIVEDRKEIRETIQKRLAKTDDMECVSAYDRGETALQHLVNDEPDVVLMDIGLPGIGGIETMLRIKLKNPEIKILMFTIYSGAESVFDALKAGADGYVLKHEGTEGIINAVREVMDGGAPMTREIAKRVMKSFSQVKSPKIKKAKLSPREVEIVNCLMKGWLYKEIADRLSPPISEGTVKQHIHRIYKKLEVNNRTEAINKYLGNDSA